MKSGENFTVLGKGKGPDDQRKYGSNLQRAREMAGRGKGWKTIVRKTGISQDDARQIVRAVRESRVRKNGQEILHDMLAGTREMLAKAQRDFLNSPKANAGAYSVQVISGEQRAILEQIAKMERPEHLGLAVIQQSMQPALRSILQDAVSETRKALTRCLAVSTTEIQQSEIESAFNDFTLVLGKIVADHYGMGAARVADIMKCKMEDIQKLAASAEKPTAGVSPLDDTKVIPFPSAAKKSGRG